jgi:asparagine synthase (glutamine-hydrolysing)
LACAEAVGVTEIAGVFDPAAAGRWLTLASGDEACALTGYVANTAEILRAAELPPSASLAAALQALVARDGAAAAVGRLRGAFTIALWDERSEQGVLATDHLGAGGLFYSSDGGRLTFASEIHSLLDLLSTAPAPDEDALIRWLAFDEAKPGRTLYAGVRRLRGGELIELRVDSYSIRTYWSPRFAAPAVRTAAEHAQAVRHEATAAVRRSTAGTSQAGVLLSGGLDSSSIAAFAHDAEVALRGYSAVFPDHSKMDESVLIAKLAADLGIPVTTLAVRGGSSLPVALEYLARWRLPSPSPNLWFMGPLAGAASSDVSVLLDGEGGDELFGFSPYVFADLLMRGRIGAARALAKRVPGVRGKPPRQVMSTLIREYALKGAVPYRVHAALRRLRPRHYAASWLTPYAALEHGRHTQHWEWKRMDGPRWWASLAFDLTDGRHRMGAPDYLRHKSVAAGVEGRHPYLDDVGLVELMLAIPAQESFDPTFDRPLVRRATAGLLPDAIRLRSEKSYFNELLEEVLMSTDRDALLQLFDDQAHISRYVQTEVLRGYVLGSDPRPASWQWIVWRAAAAECWLRMLEDASFPEQAMRGWGEPPPQFELHRAATARHALT